MRGDGVDQHLIGDKMDSMLWEMMLYGITEETGPHSSNSGRLNSLIDFTAPI